MNRLNLEEEALSDPSLESRLVRLNIEFCKRRRCSTCPVEEICKSPKILRSFKGYYYSHDSQPEAKKEES